MSFLQEVINCGIFAFIYVSAIAFHAVCTIQRFLVSLKGAEPVTAEPERLVVITGCDTGFGRGLAELLFTKSKVHVVALTLTKEAAKELEDLNEGNNSIQRVTSFVCDVTSDKDVAVMKQRVETLLKEQENLKLYALVNNAGIAAGLGPSIFYPTAEKYERTMDVNFFGTVRVTLALLELFANSECKAKRIINMSSVSGTVGYACSSTYNTTKFAVEAFTDSLSVEMDPFGVHVIKMRPGAFATPITKSTPAAAAKDFNDAPPSVQSLYGGEAWLHKFQKALEALEPQDPQIAIDVFYEALMTPSPKLSYWVGDLAKTFCRAIAALPRQAQRDFLVFADTKPIKASAADDKEKKE